MRLFLPENIWKEKRGFGFDRAASYLAIGFHGGQDFFTLPVGEIPIIAPCDGELITFYGFSRSAGWWGVFTFKHCDEIYSLKILHMHKELKAGKYKEGEKLGYCGGTGLSVKNGQIYYIGESHEEQTSENAVPHLHVELHLGEYKHDTNKKRELAKKRLLDPIKIFEGWQQNEKPTTKNMTFYKEPGKSTVYIKGANDIYYPIISGKHFLALFGSWENNKIIEVEKIDNKSDSYFGLFKSDDNGKYDTI